MTVRFNFGNSDPGEVKFHMHEKQREVFGPFLDGERVLPTPATFQQAMTSLDEKIVELEERLQTYRRVGWIVVGVWALTIAAALVVIFGGWV